MNKRVHYIGLDVHKETIAVAIAPEGGGEVRNYGIIGGTLAALDQLIKKLQQRLELSHRHRGLTSAATHDDIP